MGRSLGLRSLVAPTIVFVCVALSAAAASPSEARPASGVASFSPASGPLDTKVVIRGSGFTGAAGVTFGGVPAVQFTAISATKVTAKVPWNAASGPLCVLLATGAPTCGATPFRVTLGLVASDTSGHPGSRVKLSGSGFAAGEPIELTFDGMELTRLESSGTGGFSNQPVAIPATATAGSHSLGALGLLSGSATSVIYRVSWDWPQFHADQQHTGVSQFENTLSTSNVSTLVSKWNVTYGYYSSPVVEAGVVYSSDTNGYTRAISATTGTVLWSFFSDNDQSAPAIRGNLVYVVSSSGNLYALNKSTGVLQWTFVSSATTSRSSPAVSGNTVYFGNKAGDLYAVNATTGSLVWRYASGSPIVSSPAVANGVVYVGSYLNDTLYAVNAGTGALKWSYVTGDSIDSSPAVVGGVVYFGSQDGNVYALQAGTGALKWSFATGGGVSSSPAVSNGVVYIGSENDAVYALDAKTGSQVWRFAAAFGFATSPAVANGVVYMGGGDANVYALNAATGAQLWSYGTECGFAIPSAAVSDGAVYIASCTLYKFALP